MPCGSSTHGSSTCCEAAAVGLPDLADMTSPLGSQDLICSQLPAPSSQLPAPSSQLPAPISQLPAPSSQLTYMLSVLAYIQTACIFNRSEQVLTEPCRMVQQ